MENLEKVLVVGANGGTGRKVASLLKRSQYFEPVAMVRKETQRSRFQQEGILTVVGDLEEDLAHVVQDVDKIVFAAGSGGKKVVEVDQEGAKRLIDVAKMGHIKKFVMLSSMGADAPEKDGRLRDYLKAKQVADEHLRKSGLNYTIVRPGSLTDEMGNGKIGLERKLDGHGKISREDVAQTLVSALHDTAANGVTFEIVEGDTLIGEALHKVRVPEKS